MDQRRRPQDVLKGVEDDQMPALRQMPSDRPLRVIAGVDRTQRSSDGNRYE
jgi:hypothetical protein